MQLGWAISALIILSRVFPGKGWTQEELDLFDLVEEVGQNFYDLMQIDQVIRTLVPKNECPQKMKDPLSL